jgi:N-formylglutamate amidohydrolase
LGREIHFMGWQFYCCGGSAAATPPPKIAVHVGERRSITVGRHDPRSPGDSTERGFSGSVSAMLAENWQLARGESPLLIDVPHAGTLVPDALGARLSSAARAVPDTDWHVDKLYAFAHGIGATVMVATHSRYLVDLNRDPSGAALYLGADNTELCPTRTFANEPIYERDPPDAAEIAARRRGHFEPYHAQLAAEIERVRSRHGFAVLLDGHSIRSIVPRFFAGRLPDLNLGTADGVSCDASLQLVAERIVVSARGFSHAINGRFKGGYVTRHYGAPAHSVHALQLEIAQACYMDEAPPYRWDELRAGALVEVLRRLVGVLMEWRPA